MNVVLLLIPIALVLVTAAAALFFWAVKSGQYDDLDADAKRILFDRSNKDTDRGGSK